MTKSARVPETRRRREEDVSLSAASCQEEETRRESGRLSHAAPRIIGTSETSLRNQRDKKAEEEEEEEEVVTVVVVDRLTRRTARLSLFACRECIWRCTTRRKEEEEVGVREISVIDRERCARVMRLLRGVFVFL